jgi:hypothetical protein
MMKNCQRVSAGTNGKSLSMYVSPEWWMTLLAIHTGSLWKWLLYSPTASSTDLLFNLLLFNERRILVYYQINLGSNFLTDLCKTISK